MERGAFAAVPATRPFYSLELKTVRKGWQEVDRKPDLSSARGSFASHCRRDPDGQYRLLVCQIYMTRNIE